MGNSMQTWRLIDTGPLDGVANMAIDEALLTSFAAGSSAPVLRLYGWDPPALSLGRYQQVEEVLDLEACSQSCVTLVRRITGGGVIYHARELTYSMVCAPAHVPPAGSIKESFRHLTAFLLGFYRSLGLNAGYAVDRLPQGTRLGTRTPLCFAGHEAFDILINGKKIGGNAQRRTRLAIFQHGSIPLESTLAEGRELFRVFPPGVLDSTTSLADQGVTLPPATLAELLVASFQETLGIDLVRDTLSGAETDLVAQLQRGKYGGASWNLKGESD
jgi:lipoate-protein ligase A